MLYRMNAQSRALEDALMREQDPYRIVGGVRFYERKEIKDALAYLKLVINPHDDVSFRRVVNVPPAASARASWTRSSALERGRSRTMRRRSWPPGWRLRRHRRRCGPDREHAQRTSPAGPGESSLASVPRSADQAHRDCTTGNGRHSARAGARLLGLPAGSHARNDRKRPPIGLRTSTSWFPPRANSRSREAGTHRSAAFVDRLSLLSEADEEQGTKPRASG